MVLAVSTPALAVLALSSALSMRKLYEDSTLNALSHMAMALVNEAVNDGLSKRIAALDYDRVDGFCDRLAMGTDLRITVIAPDGTVLGDSDMDPRGMESHAGRPEVLAALAGGISTSMRNSTTLGLKMAYAAAPLFDGGNVAGILRVAMGAPLLSARMAPFIGVSALIAIAMILAIAIASLRIGSSLTEPIRSLMDAAHDWSKGRLERRVKRLADPELVPLFDTMNAMAAELAAKVVTMNHQREELEAILNGMNEAVLSIDSSLVIKLANPAARQLLSMEGKPEDLSGRTVLEVTGNVELDAIAKRCAAEGKLEESEIVLYREKARVMMVRAAPLATEDGQAGMILVLNDITRLKRLERIRRDFVANVSHELRTPITLIKGFAETLEDVEDPVEAKRFLAIIKRHADRMASITEDLLTLARIEGSDRSKLGATKVEAGHVIEKALESLGDRPASRGAKIKVSVESGLVARANEGLLEQAILNLLDNAIKYGPRKGAVKVEALADGDFIRFSIHDEGPGIPVRDQPRLFERFYRIDKARSKKLGGTGLGLAIVRHIALAHGGDASVSSREGAGSVFSIRVPRWSGKIDERNVQESSPDSGHTAATS